MAEYWRGRVGRAFSYRRISAENTGVSTDTARPRPRGLTAHRAPDYHLRLCNFEPDANFAMKTYSAKPEEITRDWYIVDASDKVLGRLASAIAHRLRGKHKPIYTPHVDTGDFIVVTNVEKIKVTGNKADDKLYHRHSGYPGGIRTTSFSKMQQRFPGRVLEKAVKGMLPKGPLGYAMLKKLKCYAGAAHPHIAQQPKTLDL
jgi:large subunit ribosomal protein L13